VGARHIAENLPEGTPASAPGTESDGGEQHTGGGERHIAPGAVQHGEGVEGLGAEVVKDLKAPREV
jgi:hypothetical protein